MQLRKYHGLGNDFLILLDVEGAQPIDGVLAKAVCDRHRGAGADGLIRVTASPVLRMELLNADGGRAETSGNGLRCVARAVADAGWDVGRSFTITTDAGLRTAQLHDDGTVSVEMGTAAIDGDRVDLGNPHLVVLVDDLAHVAGAVDGVNVEYVAGAGDDELSMRVFERGVGETEACGSGACAAAAVAHARGLVGERVIVHQPGGDVTVDLSGDRIVLTGPAEYVCDVVWPWP